MVAGSANRSNLPQPGLSSETRVEKLKRKRLQRTGPQVLVLSGAVFWFARSQFSARVQCGDLHSLAPPLIQFCKTSVPWRRM